MKRIQEIKKVTQKAIGYKDLLRYFTEEEINEAYCYLGKNFNLAEPTGTTTPAWMKKFKKFRNQIMADKWEPIMQAERKK